MSTPPPPPIGTIGWLDLTIPDAEAGREFYEAVCGWTSAPIDMGGYNDYAMVAPGGVLHDGHVPPGADALGWAQHPPALLHRRDEARGEIRHGHIRHPGGRDVGVGPPGVAHPADGLPAGATIALLEPPQAP